MSLEMVVMLPDNIAKRYKRLAKVTGRSNNFYFTEALEESIDRLEFEYDLIKTLDEVRAGKQETFTADEVLQMLEACNVDD